jgi:predicted nucleic acid-binding protein
MAPNTPAAGPPRVVLDTNAVLDWLVFADPGVAALSSAIAAGRVLWVASPRMRGELARTLAYPGLVKWKPDSEHVLTTFDSWARLRAEPPQSPGTGLRCTDPDDQVFIDLALDQGARWLVTHDRALHKLARRALLHGVQVLRPSDWQQP